jgi:hypothetical protein
LGKDLTRSASTRNGEVDLMNVKRFGVLFVALAMIAVALPTLAATDATVGDFVVRLAKARNLGATDARVAADSLRGVGVRMPADLNFSKRLTEGEVARIARTFGVNVTTTNPDNEFTNDQVDRFFSAFAVNLQQGAGSEDSVTGDDGPPFNPYAKGKGGSKGKKKGHSFTATEPE